MNEIIEQLRLAACAYRAALQCDACPGTDIIVEVVMDVSDAYNEEECIAAAKKYEGWSDSDLESEMVMLIESL